jgi:hypothetical protein
MMRCTVDSSTAMAMVVALDRHCRHPPSSRQIEESISILNFIPPNRGVDFYFEFLPAKSKSRFLLPISSRQIERVRDGDGGKKRLAYEKKAGGHYRGR